MEGDLIGKYFKFIDYFMSVGREEKKPYIMTKNTSLNDIDKLFYQYKINIDLDLLLESCPLKSIKL